MKFLIPPPPPEPQKPPLNSIKDALDALAVHGLLVKSVDYEGEYLPQQFPNIAVRLSLVVGPKSDVGKVLGELHEFAMPKKVSLVTP